jgi:hypothetical protein
VALISRPLAPLAARYLLQACVNRGRTDKSITNEATNDFAAFFATSTIEGRLTAPLNALA